MKKKKGYIIIKLMHEEQIFIDVLTGVFNRRYLYSHLPSLLEKAKKENFSVGMLMIDVDNFKGINDSYGHLVGDEVLKKIAHTFNRILRSQDKVIRYAGDEFIILIEGTDIFHLKEIAHRLIEEVRRTKFAKDIHCTISIGIAQYPQDAGNFQELIELADQALYFSKRRGKDKLYFISEVKKEEITLKIAKNLFPCKKFIGREKEILKAKKIFDDTLKEYKPGCFFVSGGIGMGKTRFLQEINNYFKNKCFFISSTGERERTSIPYYLITEAFRNFFKSCSKEFIEDTFSHLPADEANQLILLFPEVEEILSIAPVEKKEWGEEKRFFLFKGFRDLLLSLLERKSVLVSFDNLHYADIATLELIYYFLRLPHSISLLINGAFISQYVTEETPLFGIIENFRKEKRFTEITLEGFNKEEISELIKTIFEGLSVSHLFIDEIERSTKGNPYFIEEILKLLVEEGFIFYHDNKWQIKEKEKVEFPFSLEEVVRRRLFNLDPEVKEVLFEASLIGQQFDVKTLSELHKKDEGYILEILERAKSAHLIVEDFSQGVFRFNFVNPFIRETIYTQAERKDLKTEGIHQRIQTLHPSFSKYQNILKEISKGFTPQEIEKYLEELSSEAIRGKTEISLSPEIVREIYELIRLMVASIKNIRLFPSSNSVRVAVLRGTFCVLKNILKKVESIRFENMEKKLIVNGRIFSKRERVYAYVEYFLSLMEEFNLRSIWFYRDIQEQELNLFLEGLSLHPQEIAFEGGWEKFLKEMVITHIRVKEVYSEKVRREKIEDVILLEYLLGKSLNKEQLLSKIKENPQEIARLLEALSSQKEFSDKLKTIEENLARLIEETQSLPAAKEYLRKINQVISSLKPSVRKKIVSEKTEKIVLSATGGLPDEEILDWIEREFVKSRGSVLSLRETVRKIVREMGGKKQELIKNKLKGLGIEESFISFIMGESLFSDLPLEKRIKIIENLSSFDEVLIEKEMAENVLRELNNQKRKDTLHALLKIIFSKVEKGIIKEKSLLFKYLIEFSKEVFFKEFKKELPFFILVLFDMILGEEDVILRNVFYLLRDIVREIYHRLEENFDEGCFKYYIFMGQLLTVSKERKQKEKDDLLCKEIEGWLREFFDRKFIETTVSFLKKFFSHPDIKYVQDLIINLKETSIFKDLILVVFKKEEKREDFSNFVEKRAVFNILKNMKDSLIKEIYFLVENNELILTSEIIDFLVYIKDVASIEYFLSKFPYNSPFRRMLLQGLNRISTPQAKEALKKVHKERKDVKSWLWRFIRLRR